MLFVLGKTAYIVASHRSNSRTCDCHVCRPIHRQRELIIVVLLLHLSLFNVCV